MADVQDLINALDSGNKSEAGSVFADLMGDKINAALDDKRVEMARGFGAPEEQLEIELEGDEEVDVDVQELSADEAE